MATKDKVRLGKNIRKYRRKAGFTQEQLSEKVKVTPKYIQYIEKARRTPSIRLLSRIARATGVKVKDFFTF